MRGSARGRALLAKSGRFGGSDAGAWPFGPRAVPGRFVNQTNAKVAAGSSLVGERGKSRTVWSAPPWATGRFKVVGANWALTSGTGQFDYGSVVSTTNGSAALTLTSGPLPTPGVVVTGTGIPANTTVLTAAGSAITLSANATATNTGVSLVTNNIGEIQGGPATLEGMKIGPGAGSLVLASTAWAGAATRAVAAGETFASDWLNMSDFGLTAGGDFLLEWADYRLAGSNRPGGYRVFAALGEAYSYGTTTQLDVTPTGVVTTTSNWAPITILWEGKPSGSKLHVLTGDSIAMGVSSLLGFEQGLKGEQGYANRAAARLGLCWVNLTKDGARAGDVGGGAGGTVGGIFDGRAAVLDLLKAHVTPGDYGKLEVINELVTNDTTSSLQTVKDRVSSLYTKVAARGWRLKQLYLLLDASSSDLYASVANQSDNAGQPHRNLNDAGGVAAGMATWFNSGAAGAIVAAYDARKLFAVATSGASANRWAVNRSPTSLTAQANSGQALINTAVAVRAGDQLTFEGGTANQELVIVKSVTGLQATLNANLTITHANATAVQPVPTADGLHPSGPNHEDRGDDMAIDVAYLAFLAA